MNAVINRIVLFLYIVINVLFVEKYAARVISCHWLVTICYVLCTCFAVGVLYKYITRCRHTQQLFWGLVVCMVCGAIGLQYSIDPLTLNVDRWSAIHNFLSGMFSGDYPYGQQTHLGGYGSPFPVWQIFHVPFYALGNVGLSIVVVLVLFLLTINHLHSSKTALVTALLLCISPAFWYEVAVRSDLITNLMLSALITEWLVHREVKLTNHVTGIGVLFGLMLSTRLIAVIPLCVLYGYEFLQMNWKKQLQMIIIVPLVFALTMLPFVLWQGSTLLFFEYNPFVLQTRQGSWAVLLIFAIIAVSVTVWLRGIMTYRAAITGFLLSGLVMMAFVEKMWQQNLWTELFSSAFDITYLSVALPFYAIHLALAFTYHPSFTLESGS